MFLSRMKDTNPDISTVDLFAHLEGRKSERHLLAPLSLLLRLALRRSENGQVNVPTLS